jgi:hypothetical protein
MGRLEPVAVERSLLLAQIEDYRTFLSGNPRAERDQFLPFFRARPQLSAYIGTLHRKVGTADRLAFELSLWGDFRCDLVAGDLSSGAFVLAEFEGAGETDLFKRGPGRRVSRWGSRVEGAISQVTDWLFQLAQEQNSPTMERDFGVRNPHPVGLVVAGRSSEVDAYDAQRLAWRSDHTIIGGSQLILMTYDDLLGWLTRRVTLMRVESANS